MPKLDHTFYEKIVVYKLLTDEIYMSTVIDHLNANYFDNKSIANIINVVVDFYNTRSQIPTIPEIKSYLTTDSLKTDLKNVVE